MTLTKIEKQLLQDFRTMSKARKGMLAALASKLTTAPRRKQFASQAARIPVCIKP